MNNLSKALSHPLVKLIIGALWALLLAAGGFEFKAITSQVEKQQQRQQEHELAQERQMRDVATRQDIDKMREEFQKGLQRIEDKMDKEREKR